MAYNFNQAKGEFKKIEEWLSREYSSIHTGRASPVILDGVLVDAYGSPQPIKNVASISIEDARTLRIAPWDKSQIKDIEKGIVAANLGLSTSSDSDGVRAIFPMLTTENREKLVKILKQKLEDARVSIRKAREEILDDMKANDLPEDDMRRAKEELQKYVDEANTHLEANFEKKQTEVMQ